MMGNERGMMSAGVSAGLVETMLKLHGGSSRLAAGSLRHEQKMRHIKQYEVFQLTGGLK